MLDCCKVDINQNSEVSLTPHPHLLSIIKGGGVMGVGDVASKLKP